MVAAAKRAFACWKYAGNISTATTIRPAAPTAGQRPGLARPDRDGGSREREQRGGGRERAEEPEQAAVVGRVPREEVAGCE